MAQLAVAGGGRIIRMIASKWPFTSIPFRRVDRHLGVDNCHGGGGNGVLDVAKTEVSGRLPKYRRLRHDDILSQSIRTAAHTVG